jgi:hypothetical protein
MAIERLEGHLDEQVKDAQWTTRIGREVIASFPAGSGSTVKEVDCRTTLCRVAIAHRDRSALQQFTDDSSRQLHYDMDILTSREGDGYRSDVFLSRPGQKMPDWAREIAAERAAL